VIALLLESRDQAAIATIFGISSTAMVGLDRRARHVMNGDEPAAARHHHLAEVFVRVEA
jgi:hypothetical protein